MNDGMRVLSLKQLVIYEALVKYPTSYAGEIATIVYRDNVSLFPSRDSVRTSILYARNGRISKDGIRIFPFLGQFRDQRPDSLAIKRRQQCNRERGMAGFRLLHRAHSRGLSQKRMISITVLRCSYPDSSDLQIFRIFQEAFPDLAPKSTSSLRRIFKKIKEIQSCLTNYRKATSS